LLPKAGPSAFSAIPPGFQPQAPALSAAGGAARRAFCPREGLFAQLPALSRAASSAGPLDARGGFGYTL